jgi:ParB family chromosome partitioning protein
MNIQKIPIDKLYVSTFNVRKDLSNQENDDETSIHNLVDDIKINGLLHPLTVRQNKDKYEIIAGQRRFNAIKILNLTHTECNVLQNITDQKAQELSLIENVQRNQMTLYDKVNAYSKLYKVYNNNINKVCSTVHLSKRTVEKYIKINKLPTNIIQLLDKKDDTKITLDVAIKLASVDTTKTNINDLCNRIQNLNTTHKIDAINTFIRSDYEKKLDDIVDDIIIDANDIKLDPSSPYVIDENGDVVIIPKHLYPKICEMCKELN